MSDKHGQVILLQEGLTAKLHAINVYKLVNSTGNEIGKTYAQSCTEMKSATKMSTQTHFRQVISSKCIFAQSYSLTVTKTVSASSIPRLAQFEQKPKESHKEAQQAWQDCGQGEGGRQTCSWGPSHWAWGRHPASACARYLRGPPMRMPRRCPRLQQLGLRARCPLQTHHLTHLHMQCKTSPLQESNPGSGHTRDPVVPSRIIRACCCTSKPI